MIGEKLLNFLFQIQGKLFDLKGNHIEESFLTLGVVSIKPHDGTTLPRARAVPLNIGHQKRVTRTEDFGATKDRKNSDRVPEFALPIQTCISAFSCYGLHNGNA